MTFEADDDYTAQENLNWSLKTNADWLSINTSSGRVKGMPQPKHVGRYWVNVSVADEMGLQNYTNFTMVVKHTNKAPRLSNGGIAPANGTEDTVFTFYVTFTDLDNDSGSVFVIIDNVSYVMRHTDKTYEQGVNFTYKTKLKPGKHVFYFEAKDAWGVDASLAADVPAQGSPYETNHVKEVVTVEFYEEPLFWIALLIIIIIILIVLQFVLKPLSKRYPKLEFVNKIKVPDKINPIIIYQKGVESEQSGELGFLCPNCKAVVSEDDSKCGECGESFTEIDYQCPNCQAKVGVSDVFCPKCGSEFEEMEEEEPEMDEPKDEEPEEGEPEDEEPDKEVPDDDAEPEPEEDDDKDEKTEDESAVDPDKDELGENGSEIDSVDDNEDKDFTNDDHNKDGEESAS
jgi:RNA polymerase subunit RPABC4/transcription elongation factor Spt4